MIFECKRVSIRNDDGTYDAAGVRWTEARWLCEHAMFAMGLVCFAVGLVLFVSAGVVYLALVWVSFMVIVSAYQLPGRKREILFFQDGRMETPRGLSTNELYDGERWLDHTGIESIEIEQLEFPKERAPYAYTHGVRIFYADGEMSHVAKNLTADDAHMLAVRLNQARRRIKEQMQRPQLVGAAPIGRRTID